MSKSHKKRDGDVDLSGKYFEIIDYLIRLNKERSIKQMVKDLPKTEEHESSIRKKCRTLTDDFKILESREKISKPGTRFKAEYFQLNKNMKFFYFKQIAEHYLDFFELYDQYKKLSRDRKKKISFEKFYINKRKQFIEYVITIIDDNLIESISKNIKIPFNKYEKTYIYPTLFSSCPSALYEALIHNNEILKNLKKNRKKITEKHYNQMRARFTTFLQIAIFEDMKEHELYIPTWWSKMKFQATTTISPEIEIFISECQFKELREICKKNNIKIEKNDNKSKLKDKILQKIKEKDKNITIEPGDTIKLSSYFSIEMKSEENI